jgi:hypothetical protein
VRSSGPGRGPPRSAGDPGPRLRDGRRRSGLALEAGSRCALRGVDRSGWAIEEARFTLARLGLRGEARRGDVLRSTLPGKGAAIACAYVVNELPDDARDALLERLLAAARDGARVLIVEPIARGLTPWWPRWADAFERAGGRSDEWRFPARLPARLALLDRAASLDHRELTARSLYCGATS